MRNGIMTAGMFYYAFRSSDFRSVNALAFRPGCCNNGGGIDCRDPSKIGA